MLQVSRKHCMGQTCDISSVLSLFFILKTEDFHTFEDGIQHVCIDTISGPLREESRKLGQRLTHAAKSSSQKLSTSFLEQMNSLYFGIPSRELKYPTWGKGKSFHVYPGWGYVGSQEGITIFFPRYSHVMGLATCEILYPDTAGTPVEASLVAWQLEPRRRDGCCCCCCCCCK